MAQNSVSRLENLSVLFIRMASDRGVFFRRILVRGTQLLLSSWCDLLYALERRSPQEATPLPPEMIQAEGFQRERVLIFTLQSLLRRFPFWFRGHVNVAELLLKVGELEASYAACQTALILAAGTPRARPVQLLLGKVLFAYGQYRSVLEVLAVLPKSSLSREESELLGCAERALNLFQDG